MVEPPKSKVVDGLRIGFDEQNRLLIYGEDGSVFEAEETKDDASLVNSPRDLDYYAELFGIVTPSDPVELDRQLQALVYELLGPPVPISGVFAGAYASLLSNDALANLGYLLGVENSASGLTGATTYAEEFEQIMLDWGWKNHSEFPKDQIPKWFSSKIKYVAKVTPLLASLVRRAYEALLEMKSTGSLDAAKKYGYFSGQAFILGAELKDFDDLLGRMSQEDISKAVASLRSQKVASNPRKPACINELLSELYVTGNNTEKKLVKALELMSESRVSKTTASGTIRHVEYESESNQFQFYTEGRNQPWSMRPAAVYRAAKQSATRKG